jgi:UMF1 family MFS transporter
MAATLATNEKEYNSRIWAWTMYDWANSAFATTILAAVLPVYFSKVAGATLPSAARATAIWSFGLSISLLIVAILSPILGTVSDVSRSKKHLLAGFAGLGIIATGLLVLVSTGDWVLASILAILGRVGFNGSLTFYDALLPHVARPDDQDRVSARGYAIGYLGGGLLLAINIAMIQFLPGTWGARLSFLSVAIWWAVFMLPLLLRVPEPDTAAGQLKPGENVFLVSFRQIGETIRDIRRYRELFKYLLAFLIYNDGIGTIITLAAIYGAEMGLGSTEMILALLLVQFAGIPYSLIFGRLPNADDKRRPMYLAFILFNLLALPLTGIVGRNFLPVSISGMPPATFETQGDFWGEGIYSVQNLQTDGSWLPQTISADHLDSEQDAVYLFSSAPGDSVTFKFHGQKVDLTYALGPDFGFWTVELDGLPLLDSDGAAVLINAQNPAARYEDIFTLDALTPGEHTLNLINTGSGTNSKVALSTIKVLPAVRASNLGIVIGIILAIETVGLLFAFLAARLFDTLSNGFDTRRSILLSLMIYAVIAVWGFFINSVLEFWLLAWMVAIVQGGSQALSRSLYAALSPASKSGEFFGLFSVMEKFAALIGPSLFTVAALLFGSSRPAVLSLSVLFIVGGLILARVDVTKGKEAARE